MKRNILLYLVLGFGVCLISCDNDVPGKENEEEIIDKVTLTFTPTAGSPVVVTATDPDGEGIADMSPDGDIYLLPNTAYTLTIGVENTVEQEDITLEIEEEGDEHIFFFSFTNGIFSNPVGDGNIDARADAINYDDQDINDQPIGIITTWTTGAENTSDNTFRVVLKHQPGTKSATSTASDGSTDIDQTWTIKITNGPL